MHGMPVSTMPGAECIYAMFFELSAEATGCTNTFQSLALMGLSAWQMGLSAWQHSGQQHLCFPDIRHRSIMASTGSAMGFRS